MILPVASIVIQSGAEIDSNIQYMTNPLTKSSAF